ncbi:MAG: hypothetical protein LBR36_07855 [Bacteroidales bacterium]|nr:hypothetical protein [Bacteroidales bacterium]
MTFVGCNNNQPAEEEVVADDAQATEAVQEEQAPEAAPAETPAEASAETSAE